MDTTVQSCIVRSSTGKQFLLSPVTTDESDFPCCVACADENGRVIPGSRLTPDFKSAFRAFEALERLQATHTNIGVFSSMVERAGQEPHSQKNVGFALGVAEQYKCGSSFF